MALPCVDFSCSTPSLHSTIQSFSLITHKKNKKIQIFEDYLIKLMIKTLVTSCEIIENFWRILLINFYGTKQIIIFKQIHVKFSYGKLSYGH